MPGIAVRDRGPGGGCSSRRRCRGLGSNEGRVAGASRRPARSGTSGRGQPDGLRLHLRHSAPRRLLSKPGSVVHFNGSGPASLVSPPPFRVLIGEVAAALGFAAGHQPNGGPAGSRAGKPPKSPCRGPACRRSSSAPASHECWSTDSRRSTRRGGRSPASPSWSPQPHLNDKHSLRLPAGGASLVHNLGEPMATGRFDLAFLDDGAVVAGQQWSIELTFQGASGLSLVRVVARLVGGEPGGRVAESVWPCSAWLGRPAGTASRSGSAPTQTEASVDGKELAHGKGPDGPLVAIRLASSPPAQASRPQGPGRPLRRPATDPVRGTAGQPRARYRSR